MTKTNAVRILETDGISFELRDYLVDENDLSAESVAKKVGMDPAAVFKTLVARAGNQMVFAVIPGDAELDLKALARAVKEKSAELVALKEVQPLTGYIRGGVTVLGAKKSYPVVADETIELFDKISVSAGMRGQQIILAPGDYLRITGAKVAALSRPK